MPELPEVETVKRGLDKALKGDAIRSAEVLRQASIAYPDVDDFVRLVKGHKFGHVLRRGKYLLIELDKGAGLACHLRMSGRLIVRAGARSGSDSESESGSSREPKFLRVIFYLESGRELHFEDMRVFGRLWYKPKGASFEKVIPTLAELGVEPLEDMDGKHLQKLFANKSQPIKTALLDQRLIAGIGNIYADESLFLAGVHPLTPARDVKLAVLERLSDNVKTVLERSIASGGSTLRDYSDSDGVNGKYQHEAYVYGRQGQPCRTCGELIERLRIAGRSSHFCPHCQPKPRGVKVPLSKKSKKNN
ncbi:MAG: bifunctional DNA-formamidopyrimidine glycosylase/DNA-(apurinic or apyrimidinic site) lyase [Cyanobacteria bacterium REEB67]|nr:bifunctional DNA-formamidopyrimidine glycosylase/DNA-(apurinic or apyrimidinic site) lyase [Cyanobacteria bacterium REEB67]